MASNSCTLIFKIFRCPGLGAKKLEVEGATFYLQLPHGQKEPERHRNGIWNQCWLFNDNGGRFFYESVLLLRLELSMEFQMKHEVKQYVARILPYALHHEIVEILKNPAIL